MRACDGTMAFWWPLSEVRLTLVMRALQLVVTVGKRLRKIHNLAILRREAKKRRESFDFAAVMLQR